ncbi:MAG TPA: GAF domain-containing sensor histidine kinase, partial [Ktedonobacteraceae bacterium]
NQDDTEHIYVPILEEALKHTDSSAGTLMLYNAQQNDLYVAAQVGVPMPKERRQRLDDGIIGWAARKLEPLNVGDVTQPPWQGVYFGYFPGIHSELVVPILEGRGLRGVINVEHPEKKHYTHEHEMFLKTLADLSLIVIQKVKAVDRLKEAEAVSSIGKIRFQLAHRLTHDLSFIESYINLIQEDLSKRKAESQVTSKNLDRIARDVKKVLNFTEDFKKSFTNLVHAKEQPRELISIADVIQEWCSKLQLELPPNIKLQYEVPEGLASVYAVYQQIQAILDHLILNAQQAMKPGGILTLRARNSDNFIEIQVQDTGHGIPADKLDRIFEPFFSWNKKNSSGFGLYLALNYAHANDGELKVTSSPGQGTTFTLVLPIAQGLKEGPA